MQIFHRQTCMSRMRAFCRVDATHDTFHTSFNPILHLWSTCIYYPHTLARSIADSKLGDTKSFKLKHAKLTIVQKVTSNNKACIAASNST